MPCTARDVAVELAVLPKARKFSFYQPELDDPGLIALLSVSVRQTIPRMIEICTTHHFPMALLKVAMPEQLELIHFLCQCFSDGGIVVAREGANWVSGCKVNSHASNFADLAAVFCICDVPIRSHVH